MKTLFVFCLALGLQLQPAVAEDKPAPMEADLETLAASQSAYDDYLKYLESTRTPDPAEVERKVAAVAAASDKVLAKADANDSTKKAAYNLRILTQQVSTSIDSTKYFPQFKAAIEEAVKAYPASDIAGWAEAQMLAETADEDPTKFLDQVRVFRIKYPRSGEAIDLLGQYAHSLRIEKGAAEALPFVDQALTIYPTSKALKGYRAGLARIGQPVSLKATKLDGTEFDTASLKGKVVLIDFWSTSCRPCREATPALIKMEEELGKNGLAIVAFSRDDEKKEVEAYVKDKKPAGVQLYVENAKAREDLAAAWGANAIPSYFIIDRAGNLVDLLEQHDVGAARAVVEAELKK